MRTNIVILLFSVLFIVGCDSGGDSGEGVAIDETTTNTTSQSKVGCYLSGMSNASGYGSVGATFYDNYYDQKFSEEVFIQSNFFSGISANVFVLYEPSTSHKNAYAAPTGEILFGYHMFFYTIANYGELAAAGVLAHEWGHRVQQTLFGSLPNPQAELEADAFSGFYMGLGKLWDWNQIRGYFANVYATGDYNFNDPNHHGTHDQRLAAAYLGLSTAINISQSGNPMTYHQLHDLFISEINTTILARSTEAKLARSSKAIIANIGSDSINITSAQRGEVNKLSNGARLERNIRLSKDLSIVDVRKLWPVE